MMILVLRLNHRLLLKLCGMVLTRDLLEFESCQLIWLDLKFSLYLTGIPFESLPILKYKL